MTSMLTSTAAGKRKLPETDPADCAADVFIPLDGTIQILEQILEDKRVVFLRAGVASGKSTLAQYLCTQQPNKYLQVHAPLHTDLTFESWLRAFRKAVGKLSTQHDAEDIMEAIKSIYEQDQVLVFDECHLLFACPKFYEMLTKTPTYLKKRPMVLLLSAASEAEPVQGQIRLTPSEITDKFMWTPPMPNASVLASELSAASVRLTKDAVKFFFQICGAHRGISMRAMAWVQEKQRGACVQWTVEQAYGEVKLAWADEDWSIPNSFLGWLAGTRAIRVNGHYANLANIPQQMLEILCSGATSNLDPVVRRNLTVHGFLLPVAGICKPTLVFGRSPAGVLKLDTQRWDYSGTGRGRRPERDGPAGSLHRREPLSQEPLSGRHLDVHRRAFHYFPRSFAICRDIPAPVRWRTQGSPTNTPGREGGKNTNGPLAGEKLPTQPTLFEAAREYMMINLHKLNGTCISFHVRCMSSTACILHDFPVHVFCMVSFLHA